MFKKIMLSLMKGDKKKVSQNQDNLIPRYPPFLKGIPVADVGVLIKDQLDILDRIRFEAGTDIFNEYYLDCITRYAEYVHLLPASEDHHHKGAGGLFRHGLEVGYNVLIYAKGQLFDTALPPSERAENEPKWYMAAFLAGLTHDLGKPLTDYQVIDESGKHKWVPFTQNLVEWADSIGIDRYFINWNENRYRKHESMSSLLAEKIIGKNALGFLSTSSNSIIRQMFECITTQAEYNNRLFEIVKKGDRLSSGRDAKEAKKYDTPSLSIPIQEYVIDEIKLTNIKLEWGEKFHEVPPLFMINDNLYISAKAIEAIGQRLANRKVPGVPTDPKSLTESLIINKFAVGRTLSSGEVSNVWPVRKTNYGKIIWAVQFADWSIIYPFKPEELPGYSLVSEKEMEGRKGNCSPGNNDKSHQDTSPNLSQQEIDLGQGFQAGYDENAPLDSQAGHNTPHAQLHHESEMVNHDQAPLDEYTLDEKPQNPEKQKFAPQSKEVVIPENIHVLFNAIKNEKALIKKEGDVYIVWNKVSDKESFKSMSVQLEGLGLIERSGQTLSFLIDGEPYIKPSEKAVKIWKLEEGVGNQNGVAIKKVRRDKDNQSENKDLKGGKEEDCSPGNNSEKNKLDDDFFTILIAKQKEKIVKVARTYYFPLDLIPEEEKSSGEALIDIAQNGFLTKDNKNKTYVWEVEGECYLKLSKKAVEELHLNNQTKKNKPSSSKGNELAVTQKAPAEFDPLSDEQATPKEELNCSPGNKDNKTVINQSVKDISGEQEGDKGSPDTKNRSIKERSKNSDVDNDKKLRPIHLPDTLLKQIRGRSGVNDLFNDFLHYEIELDELISRVEKVDSYMSSLMHIEIMKVM
ncbi:MobH family relaxase [Hydrogenovibrio marinus]|uniref:Uncharacterized domain-containing protein n=1 Tax=Hydrogenovibrio marinus TaxID=28885 RepID=A0A066ZLQ7_HYDMR|nr:MobH family relaxase [Hydrogenovibrio marinus]KDN94733.1 hypothetical protein EI16_12630 [Hydrogenovibrio marinus]